MRYFRSRRFVSASFLLVLFVWILLLSVARENSPTDHEFYPTMTDSVSKVVTGLLVKFCLKPFACTAPAGAKLIPLDPHASIFSPGRYFLVVNTSNFNEAQQAVTDVMLVPRGTVPDGLENWRQSYSFGSKVLWYHTDIDVDTDDKKFICDIDVLFGDKDMVDSRPYWQFQPDPVPLPWTTEVQGHFSLLKLSRLEQAAVVSELDIFNQLKYGGIILAHQPKFKIMQLSDLHFGQDTGACNLKNGPCLSDSRTAAFISNSIAAELPDLIVITGDMIDSKRTKHWKSAILKALAPVLHSRVPFVFTFGDLDVDSLADKPRILQFISSLPNCYNVLPTVGNIHGLTNYNLRVHRSSSPQASPTNINTDHPDMLVSLLDLERNKIDSTQINLLYRMNTIYSSPTMFKLLFFHFPLPNFRPTGKFKLVGSYNEKHVLTTATDNKFRDDIVDCGYHVVSVGHEHENDACVLNEKLDPNNPDRNLNEIWLCYNAVTGDSGLTALDTSYDRKMRIFETDFIKKTLISWKRSELMQAAFDHQMIRQL